MYLSDGGNTDNVGLIGTLQRRVRRIALVVSTAVPLALRSAWDPSKPGGMKNLTKSAANTLIDSDITGYFGVGADSGIGYNYSANQVFPSSAFPAVVNALQDAQMGGDGAVTLLSMTTVKNPRWNIPAGLEVQVCWIYVGRVLNWEQQLPAAIRDQVVPKGAVHDPSQVMTSGPFKHFPNYPTDHIQLSTVEANLLAHLTGWIVLQHGPMLAALLSS